MLFYNIEITCMGAATVVVGRRRDGGGKAAHSGSYWLKPAKNKFTQTIFFNFIEIHITSVSGYSVHFIFKMCQIVASKSMFHQFHDFF